MIFKLESVCNSHSGRYINNLKTPILKPTKVYWIQVMHVGGWSSEGWKGWKCVGRAANRCTAPSSGSLPHSPASSAHCTWTLPEAGRSAPSVTHCPGREDSCYVEVSWNKSSTLSRLQVLLQNRWCQWYSHGCLASLNMKSSLILLWQCSKWVGKRWALEVQRNKIMWLDSPRPGAGACLYFLHSGAWGGRISSSRPA